MQFVAGMILTSDGFVEGSIGFEDGVIAEIEDRIVASPLAEGIIVPTFVNSHTHLADFIVPIDLSLPFEEVVAPPSGLKHRVLDSTSDAVKEAGMKRMMSFMAKRGTLRFIDFREGGIRGSRALASLGQEGPRAFIMGRPATTHFIEDEVSELLSVADGLAVSGMGEWNYDELKALAESAQKKKRKFALHASEKRREDIDKILDLKPSFLVHMVAASDDDLRMCAEERIPIVSCPRSNFFFGMEPPLRKMLDNGVEVALGTDNAMLTMPDMLSEMDFASRLLRKQGVRELDCVLRMAIHNGRKILNQTDTIAMKPGSRCDFAVIESKHGDPVTDLVLRSGSEDPLAICDGHRIWKGQQWSTSAKS